MTEYKAKSVHECWQIAFDYAEEMQELANKEDKASISMIQLLSKRNAASEIAWRIKHGERKDSK